MNENYYNESDFEIAEDMPDFENEPVAQAEETEVSPVEREDEERDGESEEREEQETAKVIPFTPIQGSDTIVVQLMLKQAQDGWDMTKCVEYYVNWVAEQDEVFAERMKSKEKNTKDCISFINSQARKQIKGSQGHINDVQVYGWAVHYYTETNEALGIKKAEPKKQTEKKSESKGKAKTKQTKTEVKKTYTNPLFAQSSKPVGKTTAKVVKMPVSTKKLTKAELKRGDDCGFLF